MNRNVSLFDLNGHQLSHKEISTDIRFFNQNEHEVQNLIDRKSYPVEGNDNFYPIVCTHLPETIGLIFDLKSLNAPFIVFDSFQEGKKINVTRKWQTSQMVAEAEFHENFYSKIETDSEKSDNQVSDEDLVLYREVENFQEDSRDAKLSIFSVYEPKRILKRTTDTLDCDDNLINEENDCVLITVRSRISKGKMPTKDVESRQREGLFGYKNQF